jgi:hypothetical protein
MVHLLKWKGLRSSLNEERMQFSHSFSPNHNGSVIRASDNIDKWAKHSGIFKSPSRYSSTVLFYTGWSKSLCAPDFFFSGVRWKTQCFWTIPTQLMIWRWPSQNPFGIWTVVYWTRSSRAQFGVSINVWRLAEDTLNITCNFLYCNHQMHTDVLITLYFTSIHS